MTKVIKTLTAVLCLVAPLSIYCQNDVKIDSSYTLFLNVYDSLTNQRISAYYDLISNENYITNFTNPDGHVKFRLNPSLEYYITIRRKYYLKKKLTIPKNFDEWKIEVYLVPVKWAKENRSID